ncbi:hypothetical protein WKH56_32865 [Priestia sp. SB1]|uniref:hypothetical protein n=1 Tax=Priestia sp. SB1 TaxID=3132359 RepID=UPI00316F6EAC
MNIDRLERKLQQILRVGYAYLKGAQEYHDFYYYAEEQGYEISNGQYVTGRTILVRLEMH